MKTILFALLLAMAACDDSSPAKETLPGDAGPSSPDGGGNTGDGGSDCFENPKTHFEIINACTNAQKITKNPQLNKLLPDGGLPPLN
jgi:hypothetical protein